MTSQLMTLSIEAPISDAINIFENHNVHHIPVVNGDRLVGLISKADVSSTLINYMKIENSIKLEIHNIEVQNIMQRDVKTLNPSDKLILALDIFKNNLIHALPIVDNEKLLGIITTHDILERLAIDNEAYIEYER